MLLLFDDDDDVDIIGWPLFTGAAIPLELCCVFEELATLLLLFCAFSRFFTSSLKQTEQYPSVAALPKNEQAIDLHW